MKLKSVLFINSLMLFAAHVTPAHASGSFLKKIFNYDGYLSDKTDLLLAETEPLILKQATSNYRTESYYHLNSDTRSKLFYEIKAELAILKFSMDDYIKQLDTSIKKLGELKNKVESYMYKLFWSGKIVLFVNKVDKKYEKEERRGGKLKYMIIKLDMQIKKLRRLYDFLVKQSLI